ncbi:hypothetical protein [Sphingomonas hengshuiensis]|nr:hypothetical protein [Sphingomonas hengshuiensis]
MTEEPKNDAAPIDNGADFSGMVNSAGSLFLNGWAVTRAGDPCQVTVFVDGVEAASMMSTEERAHLARRNASKGLGGWSVDLRKLLKPGPNRIDVRLPNGKSLRRSPFIHHAPPAVRPLAAGESRLYQGHAQLVGQDALRGWVMGPGGDTAVVTVHVNGREPVSFLADKPQIETIDGTQRTVFGWSIDLTDVLMPGMNVIEVRDAEGRPLGASPFLQRIRKQPAAAAPAPASAPAPAKPAAAAAPAKPASAPSAPVAASTPAPPKPAPAPPVEPVPQPAKMPSAADLDEMSLDDISLAMAGGMIAVEAPVVPPVTVVAQPVPRPAPVDRFRHEPGFFERLLRNLKR